MLDEPYGYADIQRDVSNLGHLGTNSGVYQYRLGADCLGSSFAEEALEVLLDHEPTTCLCDKEGKQLLQVCIRNNIMLSAG